VRPADEGMTATPTVMTQPPDLLGEALSQLRLEGAIFFRSELTEAFAFASEPLAFADLLHPGADRLLLFHIVARGSCWVSVGDGERHHAEAGDVIVMPYGDRYTMSGDGDAEMVSILSLLDPLPWATMPVLRHGGGGSRTQVVCGYLHSDDPLFDPALRAPPPVFVVRLPEGATASWVQASIDYAMTESVPTDRSPNPIAVRLPELVLVEVLADACRPALQTGACRPARATRPRVATVTSSMPARAATVGRRLCTSTSACASREASPSLPASEWRSRVTPRLERFHVAKPGVRRAGSPPGGSTFTTSSPASPRSMVATGPASHDETSTTRGPDRRPSGMRFPVVVGRPSGRLTRTAPAARRAADRDRRR